MQSHIVRLLLAFSFVISNVPQPARLRAPDACVSGVINTNTSWLLASSPYVVCSAGVTVAAGTTLTVEPGVTVQFQANAGNKLNVAGALNALGTITQTITFTGISAATGSWGGLAAVGTVITPALVSLNHVTIEYGGLAGSSGAEVFADQAMVTITHSLVRNSAGNGVYVSINARLDAHDVQLIGNAQNAIQLNQPSKSLLMTDLSATGNGANGVFIQGTADIHGLQRWTAPGLPYIVNAPVRTNVGDLLTIDPGNTLEFTANGWLNIRGGLSALGTSSQPITFTGQTQTPGSWRGLFENGVAEAVTQLDYVTIEYGGSDIHGANIEVADGRLIVQHSHIRYSSTDGIRFDSNSGGSIMESQIVSNTLYGVVNETPQRPVQATNNWWGDPSGPDADVSACPVGLGSKVTAGVFFQPVLTSTAASAPFPLSSAPIITLTPRRWFAPANGISKIYFDITVRDGNGLPWPGRTVQLSTSLGQATAGGITDQQGKTLAFLRSSSVGDATVTGVLTTFGCEGYLAPEAKVTFTTPVNVTDLLPNAPSPYFDGGIALSPLPVITGISTTISVSLTNPLTLPITVDVSFGFAQAGIGLVFGPIKDIVGQVIPANSSVVLSAPFVPVVSGHYCVQVSYNITAIGAAGVLAPASSGSQTVQRNLHVQQADMWAHPLNDLFHISHDVLKFLGEIPPKSNNEVFIHRFAAWFAESMESYDFAFENDPPRQDYNQITLPVRYPVPPIQPDANTSPANAAAATAVNNALVDVVAYGSAGTTALDRYSGAAEANNLQWSSEQANELLYYKAQLGTALLAYADRMDAFVQVLQTEGETNTTISVGEVISYQQRLTNQGFTAQEIADAKLIGWTDAQIEAYRQSIIAADPDEVAGNVLTKYADVITSSRALGNELLHPTNYYPSFHVTGHAGLQLTAEGGLAAPGSGNSMAQVYNSVSTIQLGNPLTHTVLIDVSPRRIDLPADWAVEVSPAQISLAPGQQTTITVSVMPGSPVPQGSVPRLAVEGYVGSQLLGGVVIDTMVPNYVPFDGKLHLYLPLVRR